MDNKKAFIYCFVYFVILCALFFFIMEKLVIGASLTCKPNNDFAGFEIIGLDPNKPIITPAFIQPDGYGKLMYNIDDLHPGEYTITVRAHDSSMQWGPFSDPFSFRRAEVVEKVIELRIE